MQEPFDKDFGLLEDCMMQMIHNLFACFFGHEIG
jgi:hypothetical protein